MALERHLGQITKVLSVLPLNKLEARMSSLLQIQSTQFSFEIVCPRCGEDGVIIWEDTGGERAVLCLTRDFYERISKNTPYGIELVCVNCDTVQRDASNTSPTSQIREDCAA